MVAYTELQELIARGDVAGIASALRGLTGEQRRVLAGPVQEHERKLRADLMSRWRERPALAVAGAAVLPSASVLTPFLIRNAVRWWDEGRDIDPTPAVLDVLRDRDASWLPDLARRLAERLPRGRFFDARWDLVAELVAMTRIEPPLSDGYVICWSAGRGWDGADLAAEIRGDPRLAALIPRLFELDEVAVQFSSPGAPQGYGWPATLARLAAEGLVDRSVLVDCCLAALQRSGRLGALRGLLAVHDALALDLTEIGTHARDYLALLPTAHSTVAGAAQRQLRRLDETGALGDATVREASEAVLLRTEKVLVRAQLDWLDKAAARDPGRACQLVLAAATGFGHHAPDLQARALSVVLKHSAGLDPDTVAGLATAAAALPPDLRARAAKAFGLIPAADGTVAAEPDGPADDTREPLADLATADALDWHELARVLVPAAPERTPPPIGSVEELAAETAAVYAGRPDRVDPVSLERVLAGLVAFSHSDRPALAAALQPLLAPVPMDQARVTPSG